MRNILFLLSIIAISILLLTSCETEITVDLPDPEPKIVVEGHVENGLPPYVILTKNQPFFGGLDLNNIGDYFIHGARIWVSDGTDSVKLVEYTRDILYALPDSVAIAIAAEFGLDIDSVEEFPDIAIYSVPFNKLFLGEVGKTYSLRVKVEGKTLTASTTIPPLVFFDSLFVVPHPNPDNDTLVRLKGRIKDPDLPGNYYRYFTKANSGSWLTDFGTVFDDAFINGQSFDIQIPKGTDLSEKDDVDFDPETYGFWNKTDTCYVRLASIDKPHYDFWRTLETERANQGSPFGSATVVLSNIYGKGGIGIWGGYGSSYSVYVPR
ncbi:MAG: DUF4249 domain-containing protein [Chitinophagales bacterium]|nr:DUF4249 domain-containing protein [Chitinophagales bacterium]